MLQAPLVQQGADGDHGGEEGSDHEDHGQIGDGLMSAEEKGDQTAQDHGQRRGTEDPGQEQRSTGGDGHQFERGGTAAPADNLTVQKHFL